MDVLARAALGQLSGRQYARQEAEESAGSATQTVGTSWSCKLGISTLYCEEEREIRMSAWPFWTRCRL